MDWHQLWKFTNSSELLPNALSHNRRSTIGVLLLMAASSATKSCGAHCGLKLSSWVPYEFPIEIWVMAKYDSVLMQYAISVHVPR